MRRIVLSLVMRLGGAIALLVGVACVAVTPKDLRDKRLDERATVDLDGVATVSLPPTFVYRGIQNSTRGRSAGDPDEHLEYHVDPERISFHFEQGQHNDMGGHKRYPVVLVVSLYDARIPADTIARVTSTHVDRFYTPMHREEFGAIAWSAELRDGAATTRRAGFVDTWSAPDGPMRWLIIHTDTARRVRVDFYAWQKVYGLEEATALVRGVAASAAATPALQRHFDEIPGHEARVAARQRRKYEGVAARLAEGCGLAVTPGTTTHGARCVAITGEGGGSIHVARFLGSIPRSAATGTRFGAPTFRFVHTDADFAGSGTVDGAPSLGMTAVFLDSADEGEWKMAQAQGGGSVSWEHPFGAAVFPRLRDRRRVYLFHFIRWDLIYNFDDVDVPGFLADAARIEQGLASGRIIGGTTATSEGWAPK